MSRLRIWARSSAASSVVALGFVVDQASLTPATSKATPACWCFSASCRLAQSLRWSFRRAVGSRRCTRYASSRQTAPTRDECVKSAPLTEPAHDQCVGLRLALARRRPRQLWHRHRAASDRPSSVCRDNVRRLSLADIFSPPVQLSKQRITVSGFGYWKNTSEMRSLGAASGGGTADAMQGRHPAVVRPAHHQIADVAAKAVARNVHIDPVRRCGA